MVVLKQTDVSTDLQDEISGAVLTGSYLTMFVNCMLWLLYGLPWVHPNSTLVITINGTGFFMEVVYLMLFIIYLKTKKEKIKLLFIMLVELRFVGILALMVPKLAHTYKLRSNIVGSICMAGNIMTYASQVIKDRGSSRSKGFGFVTYETLEEAQKAKDEMSGHFLDG